MPPPRPAWGPAPRPGGEGGQPAPARTGGGPPRTLSPRRGGPFVLLPDTPPVCPPMIYAGPQLAELQIEGRAVGLCRSL